VAGAGAAAWGRAAELAGRGALAPGDPPEPELGADENTLE